jgi:hypothetical protein
VLLYICHQTPEMLTLNKLALVPITKPIWSKDVVHAVLLSGCPLVKCVPT